MKNYIFFAVTLFLLLPDHFLANKKIVNITEIVNSVNRNKHLPWKADSYGYKQIDVELFVKTKLGVKPEKTTTSDKSNQQNAYKKAKLPESSEYVVLPAEFTWANKNTTKCPIRKIRDQSNCGSCWAVSTAAVLGDRFCIQSKGNTSTPLSHEFLVACTTRNYGCFGGYMYETNNFLVTNGTVTGGEYESDEGCQQYTIRPCGYPRSSSMPCDYGQSLGPKCNGRKCNNDWWAYKSEPDKNVFKADSWYYIDANVTHSREDRIRDEIYRNGPVTATFEVLQDFMTYKNGVYVPNPDAWELGYHAVRVIGWGVESGLKYWHVANSWGTSWGEGGFFKFLRGVNSLYFETGMTAFNLPALNSTA